MLKSVNQCPTHTWGAWRTSLGTFGKGWWSEGTRACLPCNIHSFPTDWKHLMNRAVPGARSLEFCSFFLMSNILIIFWSFSALDPARFMCCQGHCRRPGTRPCKEERITPKRLNECQYVPVATKQLESNNMHWVICHMPTGPNKSVKDRVIWQMCLQ
jgi:hypothetical protein